MGCPTPQNKRVPFLDDSMGGQIFPVKLDLVHQNPSWRCLSVPDTAAQLTHLCHSTSNKHTYTRSSVQTFLCSSQWENMSKRTNYSSGYTHPSTHCKENDIGTCNTDADIARKWSLFIIFPNAVIEFCFSEAIQIRIHFFFFLHSHIFQSRSIIQTLHKQEAALKRYQIAIVSSHSPICSFVSGSDTEPNLPRTGKCSRNKRPDSGHASGIT